MSQIIVKDISFIQRDKKKKKERKLISPPGIKILTQALW